MAKDKWLCGAVTGKAAFRICLYRNVGIGRNRLNSLDGVVPLCLVPVEWRSSEGRAWDNKGWGQVEKRLEQHPFRLYHIQRALAPGLPHGVHCVPSATYACTIALATICQRIA